MTPKHVCEQFKGNSLEQSLTRSEQAEIPQETGASPTGHSLPSVLRYLYRNELNAGRSGSESPGENSSIMRGECSIT
jgi:hypothetical protein